MFGKTVDDLVEGLGSENRGCFGFFNFLLVRLLRHILSGFGIIKFLFEEADGSFQLWVSIFFVQVAAYVPYILIACVADQVAPP